MAGHSHSANIAIRKSAVDKKRGALFGKLSKAIMVAARAGGGDPVTNLKLRYAIDKARQASMPRDNIERAIKKGTGELEGETYEEILYEGYAPGGVAVMCEILTDNRNRTAGEIRKIFERNGGNLGATGCVGWMFERKGLFLVPAQNVSEDRLMEVALEAGADDVKDAGKHFEVTCDPAVFDKVLAVFQEQKIPNDLAEVTRVASSSVEVTDVETSAKILALASALDEHEDVQAVTSNYSIPDDVLEQAQKSLE